MAWYTCTKLMRTRSQSLVSGHSLSLPNGGATVISFRTLVIQCSSFRIHITHPRENHSTGPAMSSTVLFSLPCWAKAQVFNCKPMEICGVLVVRVRNIRTLSLRNNWTVSLSWQYMLRFDVFYRCISLEPDSWESCTARNHDFENEVLALMHYFSVGSRRKG